MNEFQLFFRTVQSGNLTNIKAQLQRNPELVNIKDERGFTPLIFATYFEQEEVASLLLDYGASIDEKDASGNTALLGVCFKGNENLAKLLISKGANINACNNLLC